MSSNVIFRPEVLHEILAEARRLDRPASWVVQRAWRLARRSIRRLPPRRLVGGDPGVGLVVGQELPNHMGEG